MTSTYLQVSVQQPRRALVRARLQNVDQEIDTMDQHHSLTVLPFSPERDVRCLEGLVSNN